MLPLVCLQGHCPFLVVQFVVPALVTFIAAEIFGQFLLHATFPDI